MYFITGKIENTFAKVPASIIVHENVIVSVQNENVARQYSPLMRGGTVGLEAYSKSKAPLECEFTTRLIKFKVQIHLQPTTHQTKILAPELISKV